MKSYIAIVRQIGSECAISFPDLPGCEPAAGPTIEAARKTASHVLASHLQKLIETGEGIPPPSSLIDVVSSRQWRSENIDAIILAVKPSFESIDEPVVTMMALRGEVCRLEMGSDRNAPRPSASLQSRRSKFPAEEFMAVPARNCASASPFSGCVLPGRKDHLLAEP